MFARLENCAHVGLRTFCNRGITSSGWSHATGNKRGKLLQHTPRSNNRAVGSVSPPLSLNLNPHTLANAMSLHSAHEDILPLDPANIRHVPSPDARVKLQNLPKEQSQLNDRCASVLGIPSGKRSSSGAVKVHFILIHHQHHHQHHHHYHHLHHHSHCRNHLLHIILLFISLTARAHASQTRSFS